jgi:MFS family permease
MRLTDGYKRYVLAALTLVYTMSLLDQVLMALVLQPIKEDMHLSDTQLGFLTGIAFGLFYSTLGVPFARWADRGNRTIITSVAVALWGTTVMACFFVTTFVQLVLARVAAAIGASGCMPPTYSMVGDYFPGSAGRTQAMTIYMLSNPLSNLISFVLGGWLNERYGWRVTFLVLGVPALFMALIVKLSVAEPRLLTVPSNLLKSTPPRLADVLRHLWQQRSIRHLSIALVLLYTMGLGMGPWYAAFMMRSHAMGTTELGLWLGLIFGVIGVAGIFLGGFVAARWFSDNERGQMRLSALAIGLTVPCFILFLFAPHKYEALAAMVPLAVAFNFFLGPVIALMQRLVIDESRATTMAVVMLLANLIGMGVGPQAVGILSDALVPLLGNGSLRIAMLIVSCMALWGACHLWLAGRTLAVDLSSIAGQPRVTQAAPVEIVT